MVYGRYIYIEQVNGGRNPASPKGWLKAAAKIMGCFFNLSTGDERISQPSTVGHCDVR